jgi:hypothetical protein
VRPSIFISGATCAILFARGAQAQTPAKTLSDSQYTALGKRYTEWFFAGRADSLLSHMEPKTGEALGGTAGILDQRDRVATRAGAEKIVMEEKLTRRHGQPQFWHEGMFDQLDEPLVLRWVMNPAGQIVGVGLGPKSQTPEPDPVAAQ